MDVDRVLTWSSPDGLRFEYAQVASRLGAVTVSGSILTAEESGWRADYLLDTGPGLAMRRLSITTSGVDPISGRWSHALRLRRDLDGSWTGKHTESELTYTVIGGDELDDVIDADIAFSALTASIPAQRLGLHRCMGTHRIPVAWIAVPALTVHRQDRRYEAADPPPRVRVFHAGGPTVIGLDSDGWALDHPVAGRRHTGSLAWV